MPLFFGEKRCINFGPKSEFQANIANFHFSKKLKKHVLGGPPLKKI